MNLYCCSSKCFLWHCEKEANRWPYRPNAESLSEWHPQDDHIKLNLHLSILAVLAHQLANRVVLYCTSSIGGKIQNRAPARFNRSDKAAFPKSSAPLLSVVACHDTAWLLCRIRWQEEKGLYVGRHVTGWVTRHALHNNKTVTDTLATDEIQAKRRADEQKQKRRDEAEGKRKAARDAKVNQRRNLRSSSKPTAAEVEKAVTQQAARTKRNTKEKIVTPKKATKKAATTAAASKPKGSSKAFLNSLEKYMEKSHCTKLPGGMAVVDTGNALPKKVLGAALTGLKKSDYTVPDGHRVILLVVPQKEDPKKRK